MDDDANVKLMLLQNNAKNMQINQKVADTREQALKKTNTYRAPLSIERQFKRGFRAAYGHKIQVESVDKNTVKGEDGETYSLKQIKPVAAYIFLQVILEGFV